MRRCWTDRQGRRWQNTQASLHCRLSGSGVGNLASQAAGTGRRAGAFTLVELLVVVGIIALLVTILMPALGRALELARKTICQTQLHTMGRAWAIYFQNYNNMTPQMHNSGWENMDCLARFTFMIYCGNPMHTVHKPDYVNAGVLYKEKLVGDGKVYVCPTIKRNNGGVWFDNLPRRVTSGGRAIGPSTKGGGWWPVNRRMGSYMTYMRRRMNYYDDSSLSYFSWKIKPPDRPNAHIMLYYTGVGAVKRPGDFSWMADRFDWPGWALISHVPGINVLYLDGHVRYWQDPTWDEKTGTGKVLYDNGLSANWNVPRDNWYIDDIWMIIDGYHSPPVGQGR